MHVVCDVSRVVALHVQWVCTHIVHNADILNRWERNQMSASTDSDVYADFYELCRNSERCLLFAGIQSAVEKKRILHSRDFTRFQWMCQLVCTQSRLILWKKSHFPLEASPLNSKQWAHWLWVRADFRNSLRHFQNLPPSGWCRQCLMSNERRPQQERQLTRKWQCGFFSAGDRAQPCDRSIRCHFQKCKVFKILFAFYLLLLRVIIRVTCDTFSPFFSSSSMLGYWWIWQR